MQQTEILHTEGITVDFDGFKAVEDLNFKMYSNELRFLIGPNGAGKTTLLDVLCGRIRPMKGKVFFKNGVQLQKREEHKIAQLGIGRKFQAPSVFGSLSVRDNLELAMPGRRGLFATLFSKAHEVSAEVDECLATIGLSERAEDLAGDLSHGEKQWLEIGMILMMEPDLLLLDEPAAGMTDDETMKMGELLETLTSRHAVLVVEHDMEFVRRFAHTVTVMHEGKILCEGTMDEVQANERVAEVYLGRKVEAEA